MVTIENNRLTILIENEDPKLFLNEVKLGIIGILQNVNHKDGDESEIESSQYFLLELLKSLIEEPN